jgi:hypothetical protein
MYRNKHTKPADIVLVGYKKIHVSRRLENLNPVYTLSTAMEIFEFKSSQHTSFFKNQADFRYENNVKNNSPKKVVIGFKPLEF